MKMALGTREKRVKRLRAIFPVLGEMEEYADQIRGDLLFNTQEHPDSQDIWLPTPFGHTRDSELLTECNWEVITEAFSETCPDAYKEERSGHWGVGWSERIYVRKDDAFALKLTQDFLGALSDYASLDDERYSAAQSEKLNEYLEDQFSGYPDAAYMVRVREYLRGHHDVHTLDDVSQDMVKEARLKVHHPYEQWVWDTETGEEECYYCNQQQSAGCHVMTSIELEAGGQLRLPEQP